MIIDNGSFTETVIKSIERMSSVTWLRVPREYPDASDGVLPTLANLPENTVLTKEALAKALGVCDRTIQRMVERFEIPPPFTNGGRSCWFAGKVLAWLQAAADREAREAEKIARKFWECT